MFYSVLLPHSVLETIKPSFSLFSEWNGTAFDSSESYDPWMNEWSTGPDLPYAVSLFCMAALGSDKYVMAGGMDQQTASDFYGRDTAFTIDLSAPTPMWTPTGSMATGRFGGACGAFIQCRHTG